LTIHGMLRPRLALLLVALCLRTLIPVAPARADDPPARLASLSVSVWLEYDRPGELYIYRGELAEGTALPARITFRLPRQPNSTASIDGDDGYRYIRPILSEDEGHYLVSYDTNWPRFQIEYYDDALHKQGTGRDLDLVYRADYAIDDLVLEIKEPHGATGCRLEPPADSQVQGEDGLIVHRRDVGAVAAGQEVQWKVTYDKSDPRLSAEALGLPTPGTSAYEPELGTASPRPPLQQGTWIALILVGTIAIGGLGLAIRSGSSGRRERLQQPAEPAGAGSRRSRGRKAKKAAGEPRPRVASYCHQCGAAMNKGDVFCRQCGTRRRGA
jgi:hypothetical protein